MFRVRCCGDVTPSIRSAGHFVFPLNLEAAIVPSYRVYDIPVYEKVSSTADRLAKTERRVA